MPRQKAKGKRCGTCKHPCCAGRIDLHRRTRRAGKLSNGRVILMRRRLAPSAGKLNDWKGKNKIVCRSRLRARQAPREREAASGKPYLFGYGFCQKTSPLMFNGGLVSIVQSPLTVHWHARRISFS